MRNPIYKHGQFPCVMIYTPQLNTRISDGIRPSAKYAMTNKRSVPRSEDVAVQFRDRNDVRYAAHYKSYRRILMNLYEQLKNQLTPRHVTECYGPPIHRGDMICCPFHDDKTPSMKLYDDHFYCFGCQKSGDVIDLAAQLLGLTNREAAKRLAVDFGITDEVPTQPVRTTPYEHS